LPPNRQRFYLFHPIKGHSNPACIRSGASPGAQAATQSSKYMAGPTTPVVQGKETSSCGNQDLFGVEMPIHLLPLPLRTHESLAISY